MAKKFVRGITEIRTITNQDFDTNNVNDLLSDGNHNYIHRRKADRSEEYHCLTDNIKTITSSDPSILDVTKDDGSNTVTLTVKHDETKQNKLTGGEGITLTGGEVSIKQTNGFTGDLNTLNETQFVKTTTGATNLPPNETISDGILEVIRIGDSLKQTYTPFISGGMYVRTASELGETTGRWSDWVKVNTEAITVTPPEE